MGQWLGWWLGWWVGGWVTRLGDKITGWSMNLFSQRQQTRPSRPIRCDVWIVERMCYPTDQPTNRPTDGHSQLWRCFVAPKKLVNTIGHCNWYLVQNSSSFCPCWKVMHVAIQRNNLECGCSFKIVNNLGLT